MIGIAYSLLPLVAWGSGDYIASKLSKRIDSYTLSFFFSVIGWLAVAPLAIAMGAEFPTFDQITKFFIGSIGVNAGFIFMVKGFQNGPAGIVAPIANAYAIITAVSSWLIFGQSLSILSVLGIGVVVSGIALVSYAKPLKGEFKNEHIALVSSLLALVCFGLGFTFFGEAATGKWYENSLAFQSINVLVGAAIWVVLQKHDKVTSIKKIARMKISYIGGSLGSIGAAGLFIALESIDEIAVPAAVAAAAPLVTAILAYVFDKEHLTVLQRFSTFIIVSGIVILAINS